jgi:hypothetical protein
MPTYDIINTKTGEVKEINCSWTKRDEAIKQEGKDWQYIMSAPNLNTKTDLDGSRAKSAGSEWNSVLKKIDKAAGPKSTIFKNDPYQGKTSKKIR